MKQLRFEDLIGGSSRFILPAVGICLALCLSASPTFAQNGDEDHHFTLNVGGGLTTITGRDAGKLDHGGNVQGWRRHSLFNRYLGMTGNFNFRPVCRIHPARNWNLLNEPDGNARTYTFTGGSDDSRSFTRRRERVRAGRWRLPSSHC